MTVAIFQCGQPPAELQKIHGGYSAMVQRLLGGQREVVIQDITTGALPAKPTQHEAYVLTGSPAGVYDDLPWIPSLMNFLREARGQAKLVGICFGHQVMAQAFGGNVVKAPGGWGVGLHRYTLQQRASWMDGDAAHIDVPASHQDQVVLCPLDARVTVASAFTPFAGLDYGNAISFQFHPEFSPAFASALIETRRANYGDLADAAIASYNEPNDCARVGHWIGRFLAS